MYDDELTNTVREVMATTFGMELSELNEDTSQANCSRWTSVYHMILLVALEEQFDCSFSMDQMTSMTSCRQILDVLRKTVAGAPA